MIGGKGADLESLRLQQLHSPSLPATRLPHLQSEARKEEGVGGDLGSRLASKLTLGGYSGQKEDEKLGD